MSVAKAPERPSRRSFLPATAGLKSGVGFIGVSTAGGILTKQGCRVKHRIGASRSVNLALNLALALNADGSYAKQPFDESCVCQGFATFRPCFPGFKAGGECQTGASCRPSLSSTTTATS